MKRMTKTESEEIIRWCERKLDQMHDDITRLMEGVQTLKRDDPGSLVLWTSEERH